jgi:formylglycine-generating enzyme required for sulfatase activity
MRGPDSYTFINSGVQGAGSATHAQHPVTTISWYDALVWCNALTEYYNEATDSALIPVYQDANGIIRDARRVGSIAVLALDSADGFRLPTSDEWELSARWRGVDTIYTVRKNDWANNPVKFTQGNAASGATAAYTNSAETGTVAVSGQSGTAPVKSRKPNALGLYDMSGNVWEGCFDAKGAARVVRGGAWGMDANNLSIGGTLFRNPTDARDTIGFRVARNVDD